MEEATAVYMLTCDMLTQEWVTSDKAERISRARNSLADSMNQPQLNTLAITYLRKVVDDFVEEYGDET